MWVTVTRQEEMIMFALGFMALLAGLIILLIRSRRVLK